MFRSYAHFPSTTEKAKINIKFQPNRPQEQDPLGMRIWNYTTRQFVTITQEEADGFFRPHTLPHGASVEIAAQKIQEPGPYALIRIGDTDALLLGLKDAHDEDLPGIVNMLWLSGVDPGNIPDPAEFARVIEQSDIVCCQIPDASLPFQWAPPMDGLRKWGLIGQRQYLEMHALYQLCADGRLFQALRNKRVVLVGAKSEYFYTYFYKNEHYRNTFPQLCLDQVEIVGCVKTPDMGQHVMNVRPLIEAEVRKTYALKPDVFLLSAGLLGKYLALMVKNDGFIGIDIGNALESIMGWRNRPCFHLFDGYQHPEYEFHLHPEYAHVTQVISKQAILDPSIPGLNYGMG